MVKEYMFKETPIIFYEVDIQNDFMNEDGRLYVPGAEQLKPNIARLANLARAEGIRRVRSMDRHFGHEAELAENGGPFPYHCMDKSFNQTNPDGSYGIDFIPELRASYVVPTIQDFIAMDRDGPDRAEYPEEELEDMIRAWEEVVIEKQDYDVFTNPNLERALNVMGVQEAVVYGVATDYCVKAAVIGMQERGIQTYVVTDAISAITEEGETQALKEMETSGAKLVTLDDVIAMVEAERK